MIVGRTEVWTGQAAAHRAHGHHHHAVPQHLHDRPAPLGHRAAWAVLAADPQWGNFLEAFEQAHMDALLASSVLIVLGVVPVSVVIATMAGFAIGHLRIPGSRVLFILFLFGLTLPLAGIIIPLYYLVRSMGIYDTKLAIILPLIGLYMPFGVFWMRAHFLNMPAELSEAARVDGATTARPLLAHPRAAGDAGRLVAGHPALGSGPGTSSCSRSCSSRTRPSARWPVRWVPSRASTRRTSRCCRAGSLVILTPTLIVFLIFQRQFVSALLRGR